MFFTKKRIISLFLVFALLVPICILPTHAELITENQSSKTNFRLVNDDLNNIIYTYDQNGESYKVQEFANDKLTEIFTQIYRLDRNSGKYALITEMSTQITRSSNSIDYVVCEKNEVIDEGTMSLKNTLRPVIREQNAMICESGASDDLIWEYAFADYNDTRISRYTLTFVAAALATLICGPSGNAALISGLSAVAATIVSDEIPIVYMEHLVYYGYVRDTSVLPAEERRYSGTYSDKELTNFIGSTMYEGPVTFH